MLEDAALLDSWRSGDRDAGEALIGRYYGAVLRFFRTKAGEHADDLAQRAFLRCAEPANAFRGDSSFRAFLFGIARNVLYEHMRARLRDRRIDPDLGVSSVLDLDPRASTIALRRAEQRALVAALQRLPVDLQMTLELYYWEELSVEELGQVLDVPPGTVKSRLHRGRALLREALENVPEEANRSSPPAVSEWLTHMRAHRPSNPDFGD